MATPLRSAGDTATSTSIADVDHFWASSPQTAPPPPAATPATAPKSILRRPPPLPEGWDMMWDEESQCAFYVHRSGLTSCRPPRVGALPKDLGTRMQASEQETVNRPAPASSVRTQQPTAARQSAQVRGLTDETQATDDFDRRPLPEYACAPQAVSGNLRDVKDGFAISFPENAGCEADPDVKEGISRGVMAVMMKAPWRPTIQLVS